MNDDVIWKDLEGIFGKAYEVSNFGQIKSKERLILNKNRYKEYYVKSKSKIKTLRTNGVENHLFADLYFKDESGNIHRKSAYVHKEVAVAFIMRPEPLIRHNSASQKVSLDYRYVEHIDGNFENNIPSNLKWMNFLDLYKKQVKNGRVETLDLYKHSSLWKKSNNNKTK